MKEQLITEVMQEMLPYLDNAQMKQLREVMGQALFHYEVTEKQETPHVSLVSTPAPHLAGRMQAFALLRRGA